MAKIIIGVRTSHYIFVRWNTHIGMSSSFVYILVT